MSKKKHKFKPANTITYVLRTDLAYQDKNLCGYLRKPYLANNKPKGICALLNFQRCTAPQFVGIEETVNCYTYAKFEEYITSVNGKFDKEEWKAYKFKNPPKRK
jgi:hypothetical protein